MNCIRGKGARCVPVVDMDVAMDPSDRFRAMFDRNYRPLLAYALRRTARQADAEDIVAETFTVAWRRLDIVPTDDHQQRLWLYGVARRTVANHKRRVGRAARLDARLQSVGSANQPQHQADDSDDLTDALGALARLSDSDQELLRLALWEELSHGDIAVVVGTSVANVAVRLHRAKRRLRRQFHIALQGRADGGQVLLTRAATQPDPESAG